MCLDVCLFILVPLKWIVLKIRASGVDKPSNLQRGQTNLAFLLGLTISVIVLMFGGISRIVFIALTIIQRA